jgi:hypothetical protein
MKSIPIPLLEFAVANFKPEHCEGAAAMVS